MDLNLLNNKNILFIVHSYNFFQKFQIDILAKYFNEVYVLMRYKPIAELSNFLPIKSAKIHQKKNQINLINTPENVKIFTVPLWYFPFKWFYSRLGKNHLRKAVTIIKKNDLKFDLIHGHFTWTAGYVGVELGKIYNCKCIITIHESMANNRLFHEIQKQENNIVNTYKKADLLICVNKKSIDIFKEFNKSVLYIQNGYNKKLFYPITNDKIKEKMGLKKSERLILSIGHLNSNKGHINLIEAIKILKNDNIKCFIIGVGGLYDYLLKFIKNNKLTENVKLLGFLPPEKLNDYINASDVFVLTSKFESFGIVQIEALACGKPVVATRNGGSEEIIVNEEIGLLCEKENPVDLADKIDLALNKEWDKKKILEYAKQFEWEIICEDIAKQYLKLINGKNEYI